MKIQHLEKILNDITKPELSEAWDNCGFQVVNRKKEVNKILTALEITDSIILEAKAHDVDLIVTHHPMIFNSLNTVDSEDVIGNYIHNLIESEISVYSAHTNFDRISGGNNDYFGESIGAKNIKAVSFGEDFVRTGEITKEDGNLLNCRELIERISESLCIEESCIRLVGSPDSSCEKICWCTGSGSEFIREAYNQGFDTYITGDIKYHDAMWAMEAGINLIDAGHYGTEKIFKENMAQCLKKVFSNEEISNVPEIIVSVTDANPFCKI